MRGPITDILLPGSGCRIQWSCRLCSSTRKETASMNGAKTLTVARLGYCLRLFLIVAFCSCSHSSQPKPNYTTTGTNGVYRCCLPDAGTSCCAGTRDGTCFKYGGTNGQCAEDGEEFEAKDICAGCCPGMVRLHDCEGPPSVFYCTHCGDGVCGPGEESCNCPADCGVTTSKCPFVCDPPIDTAGSGP
jgi:hypothetical protein